MVIKIPHHHDFTRLYPNISNDRSPDDLPEWEISVPRADDIAWAIVLCYLMSAHHRNPQDFSNHLKVITGNDENEKAVKKTILWFNPFRNRHACFYDAALQEVVSKFKANCNWQQQVRISDKLRSAASLIKCSVLLIQVMGQKICSKIYSFTDDSNVNPPLITLLAQPGGESQNAVHSFLLNRKLGLKLKSSALLYFLREAQLSKKHIRKVMSAVQRGGHFLISILNSDFRMVLFDIYKSNYIVSKLAEALYQIDPKSTDEKGLSALYYALTTGNFKLLLKLYYFAANRCFETDCSYRDPNSQIVKNFHEIKKILLNDRSVSNNFSGCEKPDDANKTFDGLLRLNSFLLKTTEQILKVRQKPKGLVSDDIFEASKRRDIMVSVLDTYDHFFQFSARPTGSVIEDYINHRYYYYSIDVTAATIFFDNIIYLKERLSLGDKWFSEMESCFLFLVSFNVIFDILKDKPLILGLGANNVYEISLMLRQDMYDKAQTFSKILRETVINDHNVVGRIPDREIYAVLSSYPEIKDLIQTARLKYYLKAALSVKIFDVKSVLVIERTLQVLGDYVSPEKENDSSIRCFVQKFLPENVYHVFHRVRHEISHLKGHTFPNKIDSEKNYSLFRSIQTEIRSVSVLLRPVFRIQSFRQEMYLFHKYLKALEQMTTSKYYDFSSENQSLLDEGKKFFAHPFIGSFLTVFHSVLYNLEHEIKNVMSDKNVSDNAIVVIKEKLGPVKYLLQLSQYFPNSIRNKTDPLSKHLTKLNDCNTLQDLKENIVCFFKEYEVFISLSKIPKRGKIKSIENCEIFLKILKGFTFLSDYEKDRIRKQIPPSIIESADRRKNIMTSVKDGFSLPLEKEDLEISYLSKTKQKQLNEFYKNKDLQILKILETLDPVSELEEIFTKNSVNKKNYETLCKSMKFSEEIKKKLWKLVAGQRQKIEANTLEIYLNRTQLLKRILIEEDKEIAELWTKIISIKSRQYVIEKIIRRFVEDGEVQAAAEAALFDCMILLKNEKNIEHPWIKSSKFYAGIYLQSVIGHGNPLLEFLCELLDPEDLSSEIVYTMLRQIENEDSIVAILELYEKTHFEFAELVKTIESHENDEYDNLRQIILKCKPLDLKSADKGWKDYLRLIPLKRQVLLPSQSIVKGQPT